jgi:hypothetical protein
MTEYVKNLQKAAATRLSEILAQREEILEAFIAKYGKDPADVCQVYERTDFPEGEKYYVTTRQPSSLERENERLKAMLDELRLGVIKCAAKCATMGPSEEASDWVKGRIGMRDAVCLKNKAERINEKNRQLARDLRHLADSTRVLIDTKP